MAYILKLCKAGKACAEDMKNSAREENMPTGYSDRIGLSGEQIEVDVEKEMMIVEILTPADSMDQKKKCKGGMRC